MPGILQLMLHAGIGLLPALFVDKGLGLVPDTDEILYLFNAATITVLHLLIDGTAAFQSTGPGHAMEP